MRNYKRSMLCVFELDLRQSDMWTSLGCPRLKALALSRLTQSHIVYNGVSTQYTVSQGKVAALFLVYETLIEIYLQCVVTGDGAVGKVRRHTTRRLTANYY